MRLGPKARVLLDLLLMSGLDLLEASKRPPLSILDAVGWSSGRNFDRHLNELNAEGWIDWDSRSNGETCILKLTELGKKALLENIDPVASWTQKWDGKWRTLSFDLPQNARKARRRLDVWLRKNRFGHLQGSVWISHRSYNDWSIELDEIEVDPRAVLFQECIPIGRLKNADYVSAAWDFNVITSMYQDYIRFLSSNSPKSPNQGFQPKSWLKTEAEIWKKVFNLDPFLPEDLLPPQYLGKIAWSKRRDAYQHLGEYLISEPNP